MRYTGWAVALTSSLIIAGIAAGVVPRAVAGDSFTDVVLAPHRAVYELSLGRTRQGANVVGAKGAMVMELRKSCAGWTVKQRLRLNLVDDDGNTISTDSNFSSFESLDGLTYRFTNSDSRNGQVTEQVQGNAKLKSLGGTGTADFTQPEGTRFDLPKGTLFPTMHMKALLAAAHRGDRVLYKVIFDGATLDGPIAVNAVIGAVREHPPAEKTHEPLTNRRSWPMRLAFFPLKTSKAEPDYELGLRVYDNGVSDDYVIDYGAFAVNAKLDRIEALEQPKC